MAENENSKKNSRKGQSSRGEGWLVILHNDNINAMDDVVVAVHKATSLPLQQVVQTVQTAHEVGHAYVTVTTRMTAQKIRQNLEINGIHCTIREC